MNSIILCRESCCTRSPCPVQACVIHECKLVICFRRTCCCQKQMQAPGLRCDRSFFCHLDRRPSQDEMMLPAHPSCNLKVEVRKRWTPLSRQRRDKKRQLQSPRCPRTLWMRAGDPPDTHSLVAGVLSIPTVGHSHRASCKKPQE